jgi:hypothetical protein
MSSFEDPVALAWWVHHHFQFPGPPANFTAVLVEFPFSVDLMDWPDDLSGVMVRGGGINSIGLNRNHSRGRRHFTLWHEFFHFLVHHQRWHFQCGLREQRRQERDCDIFAAHVLMPEEWVLGLQGSLWVAARRLEVWCRPYPADFMNLV